MPALAGKTVRVAPSETQVGHRTRHHRRYDLAIFAEHADRLISALVGDAARPRIWLRGLCFTADTSGRS